MGTATSRRRAAVPDRTGRAVPADSARTRRREARWAWPAYAAAAWAALFAAQSAVSAIAVMAGSASGADAIGRDIAEMAREGDAGLIVTLWVAAAAKALAAALALAPVRPFGRRLRRRGLSLATYAAGALVLLYGAVNLVEHVLMQAGATAIPDGLGAHALPWHLWLWDPYWIVGGVLFLLAGQGIRASRLR